MSFRTEWFNKLWLSHSMSCYVPAKNKLRIFADLERGLGYIITNERQDEKKFSYCDLFVKTTVTPHTPKKCLNLKGSRYIQKVAYIGPLRTSGLLIYLFSY